MKKYLVSGFNPFYGAFGGIQAVIILASSLEDARRQAIEKFGGNFGNGMAPHEKGIHVEETTLNSLPKLPGRWE